MNCLKTFALFSLLGLILSCSSSDDSNDPQPLSGDYFPSTLGDLWTYNVVSTDVDNPAGNFTGTDLLTIATSSGANFTLQVNNGTSLPNGTFNALLVNGTLTKTDETLTFNGNLQLPAEYSNFFDQDITLSNLVMYDLNASNNQELSSNSDTITQDLVIDGETFPITVNYSFVSTKAGYSASETVDGTSYSNVVKTKFTLTLEVSTTIDVGFGPTQVSVLDSQDVLTINTSYAENVGLIKAYTETQYQVSSEITNLLTLLNVDLGFPESNSGTNDQELDSYFVTSN